MKIGLVSPYDYAYPGGVNAHVLQLDREFTRLGHEVKILAPSSKPSDLLGVKNLVRLGMPIPVPGNGSVARICLSPWLIPKIKSYLEQENFDVIHLHNPYTPLLPLLVLQFSKSPNVATFHGFHEGNRSYVVRKRLLRKLFGRLQGHIVVSPPVREFMIRYFPADYHVIPNSIDVEHFASVADPIPEFLDGKCNILFVGRLEKRKGFRYLLQAYSRLKWQNPDIRLLVVGPDLPDRESHQIIGERNLQDVVFVGGVSYRDLPRYYQTAHIFCAPATGKESFGIVLAEAMAARVPIVASDIEGFASVISSSDLGILVPPRDYLSLADALSVLIQDPLLRKSLVRQGTNHVQQYNSNRIAAQVVEVYRTAIETFESQRSIRPSLDTRA